MKTCRSNFPGTDKETSDRLEKDVETDEKAILGAIRQRREESSTSFEAIGFLMGTDPAQLSRYLKGTSKTTLTNYLRIARALGYRCELCLERAETSSDDVNLLSEMKLSAHKVYNRR